MLKGESLPSNVNIAPSTTGEFKHVLHFYSSGVNKYSIQIPFLATVGRGSAVYVTADDPETVKNVFKMLNPNLIIVRPEKLGKLLASKRGLRIVVDAGSISLSDPRLMENYMQTRKGSYIDHLNREEYLKEKCGEHTILCTYDMSKLSPELVKQLVSFHDKLILTTSDMVLLAGESPDRTSISEDAVQQLVKDELESIVLTLLLRKPLCGVEIIKAVYDQFNVLLSPGTVYPLLHLLEKRGMLKCEYGVKNKTYRLDEAAKEKIFKMLEERVRASLLLNSFLQTVTINVRQKEHSDSEK
ncbi:MAG: PadR family transcriptional regulator [Thaumarchaeota archaeon]|nr:PadR family transcriptional regulator [Nitrososphaerota archaeon]